MARGTCFVVVAASLLAGCYRPAHEGSCETSCSLGDRRCPANMACGLDLRCHAAGAPDCSDAAVIIPDVPSCYGTGLSDFDPICDPVVETQTMDLGGQIDTDASCNEHVQRDGSIVCVLIATDITVTNTTRVTGSRPLALIATHDFNVPLSTLDAGGHATGNTGGAGHDPCPLGTQYDGTANVTGGGGGAGGAFQGPGGAGGAGGYLATPSPGPIAPGGMATPPPGLPTKLRGGCDGRMGGGSPGTPTNNQGMGGGGLYLIAGNHLQVAGRITASGGGGIPGGPTQGGGGGGAGGLIVLEAPWVTVTAFVTANGGAGAGGSGNSTAGPGADGDASTSLNGAVGGAGTKNATMTCTGGTGGHGSMRTLLNGGNGFNEISNADGCGGGGGGGGAGLIMVFATTKDVDAGVVSPQ